jgi:hypothetical protein
MLLFGVHNCSNLVRKVWNFTKPGGWLERQEGQCLLKCDDGSAVSNSFLLQRSNYIQGAMGKAGLDAACSSTFSRQLGNQQHKEQRFHVGDWGLAADTGG